MTPEAIGSLVAAGCALLATFGLYSEGKKKAGHDAATIEELKRSNEKLQAFVDAEREKSQQQSVDRARWEGKLAEQLAQAQRDIERNAASNPYEARLHALERRDDEHTAKMDANQKETLQAFAGLTQQLSDLREQLAGAGFDRRTKG